MHKEKTWAKGAIGCYSPKRILYCLPSVSQEKKFHVYWNTKSDSFRILTHKEDMGNGCNPLLQSVWIRLLFDLSNSRVKFCFFNETLNPNHFEFWYMKRSHGRSVQSFVAVSLDSFTVWLSNSGIKYCFFNETVKPIPFEIWHIKRRHGRRVQSFVTVNLESFLFRPK